MSRYAFVYEIARTFLESGVAMTDRLARNKVKMEVNIYDSKWSWNRVNK